MRAIFCCNTISGHADDADPGSADGCEPAVRDCASVNAARLRGHHVRAGDVRHEHGHVHAQAVHARARGNDARSDASTTQRP